jgi:hypothetical protein
MSLEELLFRNETVREALGAGEIDRLLATVDRRLEDASPALLHPETRLEQAYHAILGCAVIGLRAHGLRAVDRPGHHVVALEALADTLGVTLDRVDYFQTLRDLRNKDLYTAAPTSATLRPSRPSRRPAAWPQTRDAGWRVVAPALQARLTYPAAAHFSGARRRAPLSTPQVSPRTESHEQDS